MCTVAAARHAGPSLVSACKIRIQSPVVAAMPAAICPPRPLGAWIVVAPYALATSAVRSVDPPSTTTSSATGPKARNVAGSVAAAFKAGMTTEIGNFSIMFHYCS